MIDAPIYKVALVVVACVFIFTSVTIAGGPEDPIWDPEHNIQISGAKFGALGGISEVSGTLSAEISSIPPSMLARRDYQNLYDEAQRLLDIGVRFRTSQLQVPVGDGYGTRLGAATLEEALLNYKDFNDGQLFYSFCADYDQVTVQGYCPEGPLLLPDPDFKDVRNKLIRSRDLFAYLSLVDPPNLTLHDGAGNPVVAREVSRQGVLAATREIANVHLIFGNEFLVDALDYRFSLGGVPAADEIIQQEMAQLGEAHRQFELAFDVLVYAFNADIGGANPTHMADYFGREEFELFGISSERLVVALAEMAQRYRQQGKDDEAIALYTEGAAKQYLQFTALAQKAEERNIDFMANGGWQLKTNLNLLRAQVQALRNGLNAFGYADDYVPLQTYSELSSSARGFFLDDAIQDETDYERAYREFDQNATAMNDQLRQLREKYQGELIILCGSDFVACDGGLMEQNYFAMLQAETRIRLAKQRLASIPERIAIEQERAGHIINLVLENGEQMAAWDYTIALNSSYSESEGTSSSTGHSLGGSVSVSFPWGVSVSGSYSHSWSESTSKSSSWNPNAPEIAYLTQLKAVRQSAEQAQIEGIQSKAAIRNLLLEQAVLLLERDLAVQASRQLSAEHNHLVERYRNLLDLQGRAQQDILDSYFNNPAYRIIRDTWTVEAVRSHNVAAQFAYLTGKALEYELLEPLECTIDVCFNDIFKARTADDIRNYLNYLEVVRFTLPRPSHQPRSISLAEDILGLTDENVDPDGVLTPSQRQQRRFQLFQEFLQGNTTPERLRFNFTTSLANPRVSSSNIWNHRIAGVGAPDSFHEGVAINILTRQFGDVGNPEVVLTHGGQASYRNKDGEIVEYTPDNAILIGYELSGDHAPANKSRTATILARVNGVEQGSTKSDELFNLSIATSNWTLRIDLGPSSPNDRLEISQIEDIILLLDATALSRQGVEALSAEETANFIAEFERAKRRSVLDLASETADE